MPYTTNQGLRIHYEVEGQGIPLVLLYGQYFPLEVWYELNYVRELKDYRLILIDARGHGQSDKPHEAEAYGVEPMVSDVVAVLDALGLEKANYMGYSAGGLLGFGLARFAPERFSSFIIGGTHPYDNRAEKLANAQEHIQMLEKQTTEEFIIGLEAYLKSLNLPVFSPYMKTAMLRHDIPALIAWRRGFAEWPGFEETLGKISVPCLLYSGDKDDCFEQAQKAAREIPDAAFVSIPGGDHLEGGTWVNILAPHIRELLNRTSANNP